KDRTGFAAALLLHALEVPHEAVLRDYLLTNARYPVPAESRHGLPPEVLQVLWRVQPAFLQAAYDAVEQHHGGLQSYLREDLGLGERELRHLRALLLV
ncbi:MAG TPA: tyrosine-protein phosphatase, partial [Ramlibacter sp.]|nr:tyrosine-protein phosphatase [Ramlibacter sp.]